MRYRVQGAAQARYFQPPQPSKRVVDGQVLAVGGREWVAVHTPGHTVDHLCLLDPVDGTLISGDHVLPTITPHISGLVRADDPLQLYLGSLERTMEIPGVTRVLPAHGHPFDDLRGRVKSIHEHHLERLDILRHAAADVGEGSVAAYSEKLFKPHAWGPMADSETYAHLEHLRTLGEANRRWVEGELRYQVESDTSALALDDAPSEVVGPAGGADLEVAATAEAATEP
jgi:glyoxylase-like metal-dependent hydrolase (beta-lactamase superfamily II)